MPHMDGLGKLPDGTPMEANPEQISSAAAFQQNDLGNVEMQSQYVSYGGPEDGRVDADAQTDGEDYVSLGGISTAEQREATRRDVDAARSSRLGQFGPPGPLTPGRGLSADPRGKS